MPLRLAEDDISFTLYNINFDNIAKLLEGTSEAVLGITISVNIYYEISFKELPAWDNIESLTVVSNDLDSLNKIQDNLAKYFVNFLNNIFKSKNFEIIVPVNHGANKNDIVWDLVNSFVAKYLSDKNILFKNNVSFLIKIFNQYRQMTTSEKRNVSVLSWTGEGYPKEKLTAENFLKFYKLNFRYEWKDFGKYYVVGNIHSFKPRKFTIENLPFKNPDERIILKQEVRLLREKDKVEDELAKFAKMTMDFWHYFKLETWNDNNRLVFKMNQADFDKLVEKTSKNYKHSITTDKLEKLFGYIVELFLATLDSETKKYFNYQLWNQKNKPYKINWIKTEKVMILKYLREMDARDNRYFSTPPYFFITFFLILFLLILTKVRRILMMVNISFCR